MPEAQPLTIVIDDTSKMSSEQMENIWFTYADVTNPYRMRPITMDHAKANAGEFIQQHVEESHEDWLKRRDVHAQALFEEAREIQAVAESRRS